MNGSSHNTGALFKISPDTWYMLFWHVDAVLAVLGPPAPHRTAVQATCRILMSPCCIVQQWKQIYPRSKRISNAPAIETQSRTF